MLRRTHPWPLIVVYCVAGLLVIVAAGALWFVRRPFPKVSGQIRLEGGPSSPVEILRDEDGVPHIWAADEWDLYFAQGFVHAQDRFWQMEFHRRIGQGSLSEILGEDLVPTDRWLRTMEFTLVAERQYAEMADPYVRWMEAYAAGVNAYIGSRKPGRLGLEFALLKLSGVDFEIAPWEPVHTLTWTNVMATELGGNLTAEFRNLDLLRYVGRRGRADWARPYREDMPVVVDTQELDLFRRAVGIPADDPTLFTGPVRTPLSAGSRAVGSNNWVISPERTSTGGALLANDMHLGVQMPSVWHEIGLHVEGVIDLRGFQFPGVPGIVAGQNGRIAWGHTNLTGDVQDLYIERIHPENPDLYRVGDTWEPVEVRTEVIEVRGREEPVIHRVRTTRNGPLVTDLESMRSRGSFFVTGEGTDPDHLEFTELSLRWTALGENRIVEALFDVNRAEDFDDFRRAMEKWGAPGQNVVYADADGNIGYQSTGVYPRRPGSLGQAPVPGWDNGYRWSDSVPFDRMPGAYNPPKGFIVSANNAVTEDLYPFLLGMDFANGHRARQITGRIEEYGTSIGPVEIASIQGDVYSRDADETLPYLAVIDLDRAIAGWEARRETWSDKTELAESELTRRETKKRAKTRDRERRYFAESRDILLDWDRRLTVDSPGAAAYGYVWKRLTEEAFADDFPDGFWPPTWFGEAENALHYLLNEPDNPWWDDARTPDQKENRDDILARALIGGLRDAREAMGKDPRKWSWGEVHQVSFRNPVLGESGIGIVEALFNRGPHPAPGGISQVCANYWDLKKPFEVISIPSQRAIYDLADPSKSLFVHPPGQSGHPLHRHYDDFIEPWLNEEYHPARWTRREAEESAGRRRLTLDTPKNNR